jgi:deazaflavin-dependent oxidoreductase (nitroreductase family)
MRGRVAAVGTYVNDFNKRVIDDLRAHGGRGTEASGPFNGRELLILTTRGAKSGAPRENPLAFTELGDGRYMVIASKGGAPAHPAWFHNVVANPDVDVEVHGKSFKARARIAEGDEHDRLYKLQADRMPGFWDYQKKTSRKIPVVVLDPVDN